MGPGAAGALRRRGGVLPLVPAADRGRGGDRLPRLALAGTTTEPPAAAPRQRARWTRGQLRALAVRRRTTPPPRGRLLGAVTVGSLAARAALPLVCGGAVAVRALRPAALALVLADAACVLGARREAAYRQRTDAVGWALVVPWHMLGSLAVYLTVQVSTLVRLYADYPYQLFAMSNRHRAHGTWSTYTWHNEDPLALTEWFAQHFPGGSKARPAPAAHALRRHRGRQGARGPLHHTQVPELDRATYGTLLDPANLGRESTWDLPAHLWEPVTAGPPPPGTPVRPGGRDT
ncbi:hypothetical protein SMICM304S_08392 [Streptomyces microflavus]